MPEPVESSQTSRNLLIDKLWQGVNPYTSFSAVPQLVSVQGWSGSRHPWLQQAVEELRPLVIIEIGAWKGASTIYMAEALRAFDIPGMVIAVDTWLGSAEHRMNTDWFASLHVQNAQPTIQHTFMANVLSRDLQNFVLPLPLDSRNAAELIRLVGLVADLIHIDAGTTYNSVTADIEAWWPLLRPGGILVGNDYHASGALFPGVRTAFDMFTSSRNLAFDHNPPKIRIRKLESDRTLSGLSAPSKWSNLDRSLPPALEYTGEFGPELVLCLPFLNWLSSLGLLKNRRIVSYRGMRCFYNDLECLDIVEKDDARRYVQPGQRASWLPVQNEHNFDGRGRSPQHLYPDLRAKFSKFLLLPELGSPERPLLIVHNKYNNEWNSGAINHINIDTLRNLFTLLGRDFTIVYIRHGISAEAHDFVEDHNVPLPFDDRRLLQEFPEVLCFDDLYAAHRAQGGMQDLNTFKNVLYSRCYRFISSQGGGAHQIALYSGSLLAILHRRGSEENWAYGKGYYGFMATIPPHLAICRTEDDLLRAFPLFLGTTIIDNRVLLNPFSEKRLAELSPFTIVQRTG